jgi:hypothetical protein
MKKIGWKKMMNIVTNQEQNRVRIAIGASISNMPFVVAVAFFAIFKVSCWLSSFTISVYAIFNEK